MKYRIQGAGGEALRDRGSDWDRRVVIVLPAHNEEASLPSTLRELHESLSAFGSSLPSVEIVVVNDGSSDSTGELARTHGATVLTHVCNLGYGAAVSTGLRYALQQGATAAVILDADGQHDPRAIPELVAPVLRGEADLSIGSRFVRDLGYRTSLSRRIGSAIFSWLLSLLARRRICDSTSGFQCLGPVALSSLATTYPTDYPDAQVILQVLLAGMRVVEVPTAVRSRTAGTSMHSWRSILHYPPRMVLSMIIVLLRWSMGRLRRQAGRGSKEHVI